MNGTERVVVSQPCAAPASSSSPVSDSASATSPSTSSSRAPSTRTAVSEMEFDVEHKPGKDVTAGTVVARKRRLGIFTMLRALGYDEENAPGFLDRFVNHFDFLEGQWEQGARHRADRGRGTRRDLQAAARASRPPSSRPRPTSATRSREPSATTSARVGRYKLNRKLGNEVSQLGALLRARGPTNAEGEPLLDYPDENQNVLSRCEVLASITCMLHLVKQEPGYRLDDQDHFANRRIRSVGELIQNQVRIGLSRMERVVRERMTTQDVEAITPQTLINIRPVVAAIKEFFGTVPAVAVHRTRSTRLSGLTHRRRLSALGPAGLPVSAPASKSATSTFSHYGRMCPIETPEGPNIGLIGGLATYARVNEFGFIESPYREVKRQGHRQDRLHGRRRGGELRRRPGRTRRSTTIEHPQRAHARASFAAGRQPRGSARRSKPRASSVPPPTSATSRRTRSTSSTSRPSRSCPSVPRSSRSSSTTTPTAP